MMNIKVSMLILLTYMMKTISPIKMSIGLVGLSGLMVYTMKKMTSSNWFPLIFFLMFMGGIIVVFMILSAIHPNQKSSKSKKYILFLLPIILTPTSLMMLNSENLTTMTKWVFGSSTSLATSMIVILFYFFSFIFILSKEKHPLR